MVTEVRNLSGVSSSDWSSPPEAAVRVFGDGDREEPRWVPFADLEPFTPSEGERAKLLLPEGSKEEG